MSTVRAKFVVETRSPKSSDDSGERVTLRAVTSGSPENESFFRYTPSGTIALEVVSASAYDAFILGNEYYVDFTPAKGGGE